jgi:DNA-binding PadR family transcriptional regulator
MPLKTTPVLPKLNDRQRHYLLAAYQLDQRLKAAHKNDYHRGIIAPASEWRAMPYGRWQHFLLKPPTELRQLIEEQQAASQQRLVDPGTGSTWKALAERGLVEVEERAIITGPDGYSLPHILLTREGRKLVRHLTGEVRPVTPRKVKPPQPEGLLPAQQWLALVRLYELDFEGLPADDEQGLSYERIPYKTLEILREQGLVIGSPIDQPLPAKRYTITDQGREFYYTYYRTNALAYHRGHELPRPVLTAEQRAFWQRMEELNLAKTKAIGPTKEAYEAVRREMLRFQIAGPFHTLYVAPYWYVALAGRGIQLAPNIALVDSHLDTEEEAIIAGQQLVERWKLQLSWLEPTA